MCEQLYTWPVTADVTLLSTGRYTGGNYICLLVQYGTGGLTGTNYSKGVTAMAQDGTGGLVGTKYSKGFDETRYVKDNRKIEAFLLY